MYFTYVLKSIDHNKLYKGHTDNLPRRIIQHNNGKTSSTRPFLPYELVYYEVFETRNEAVSRKRYFESAAGRKFLKKKLSELGF